MKRIQRIIWTVAITLASMPFALQAQNCTPACVQECDEPLGTCCCPYPPKDYPTTGGDDYHILKSYKLTPDQEATFGEGDGLSPFWNAWEENPGTYDYVELLTTKAGNTWERSEFGFINSDDASMEVRSAWGGNGLYLYLLARDDQWVEDVVRCIYNPAKDKMSCWDDPAEIVWANDAMDIYLDMFGTDLQQAQPDVAFVQPSYDRRTNNMLQLQCQYGVGSPPTTYSFNTVDVDGNFQTNRGLLISEMAQEYHGMAVNFVNLSDDTKVQEWFIPWDVIKKQPQPNTIQSKLAFACGYNDADDDPNGFDALRWRNAADPLYRIQDWATGQSDFDVPTEAWGDIDIVDQALPVTNRLRSRGIVIRNVQSVEYYDLLGKTIAKFDLSQKAAKEVSLNTGASMLLERITTKSGSIHTQSIMVPQSGIVSRSF